MTFTTSYTFTFCVGSFTSSRHRHQIEGTDGFYCLLRKTLAKRGKRNCQSSEAKSRQQHSNSGPPGRRSHALSHSALIELSFMLDSNSQLQTTRQEKTTGETSHVVETGLDKYWSDTIWQRTAQDRLTWRRKNEAFAQPRDNTAVQ